MQQAVNKVRCVCTSVRNGISISSNNKKSFNNNIENDNGPTDDEKRNGINCSIL